MSITPLASTVAGDFHCVFCGALPDEPCRQQSGRSTPPHRARRDAAEAAAREEETVMGVMSRASSRAYVIDRVEGAVSKARAELASSGSPRGALTLLADAVLAAEALGYVESSDAVNEMLQVYDAADDRAIAILNAVNWGVPVGTVLRAAGLDGTRRL